MRWACGSPTLGGWWSARSTGLFVCNGPVLGFTFGVFLKPIMADMGWDRGTASLALSVGSIYSALAVPVLGWMMDRWSIRRVALPGLVIYAGCLGLLGLSPHSLPIFTLLLALAEHDQRHPDAARLRQGDLRLVRPPPRTGARHRDGRVSGLAPLSIPQLARILIDRLGWRGAYVALGLLTLAIAFPAVAMWIREPRPGEGERRLRVGAARSPGLERRRGRPHRAVLADGAAPSFWSRSRSTAPWHMSCRC